MKWVIVNNLDEFNALNVQAAFKWNALKPKAQCDNFANPRINPVSGLIAFPVDPSLGIDYPTATELDETWDYPTDPTEQKKVIDEKIYHAGLSEGFDTGHGYKISIGRDSFKTISVFIDWLESKLSAKQLQLTDVLYLEDIDGVKHPETVEFIVSLKLPYGDKCLEVESKSP